MGVSRVCGLFECEVGDGAKIIAALKCFFDLQKGKYVTRSNLLSYRTIIKPKNFKPKQLEELDPDQLYKAQDLENMFGLDFSINWKEVFANVNNPEWKRKKNILQTVLIKVLIFLIKSLK